MQQATERNGKNEGITPLILKINDHIHAPNTVSPFGIRQDAVAETQITAANGNLT
jgi:hypothetical protein